MIKFIKKILRKPYRILRIIPKVNWYKTFRVNYSLLPFDQARKLPIIVTGKLIIDSLAGKVIFDCPIKFGMVIIGMNCDNMPIAVNPVRLVIDGNIIFKGKSVICSGASITVFKNANLELGRYAMVFSGVFLKSTYYINVGDYTRFASGCFVQDSNIHLIKDISTGSINRVCKPIIIGKGCWIGMNCSILSGAVLPDYSILGRYAFFNKDHTNDGIGLLLVGSPARVIKKNVQRLFNFSFEQKVTEYFINNPEIDQYKGESGLEVVNDSELDRIFQI